MCRRSSISSRSHRNRTGRACSRPARRSSAICATWSSEFGLGDHLRLNATVVSAEFTGAGWRLETADGIVLEADFVIAATGVLHHPFTPDIPGLDTFAGDVVHTARWDDGIATDGRRIAVIGTGSTGVQVVSALQPKADHVAHFVRTPQWVMWAPMGLPQPAVLGALLRRLPAAQRVLYDTLLWGSGILADIATRPSWRRSLVQQYARWSLRAQIRDRTLRDRLTPDYQPLCKRQVVSGSYYRALRASNAELVTDGDRANHAARHPDRRLGAISMSICWCSPPDFRRTTTCGR